MTVNFDLLESQLSETEMALFMMTNVTMNAALLAGADAAMLIQHLRQHEDNFTKLGHKKSAHMFAAAALLLENASGIKPAKY